MNEPSTGDQRDANSKRLGGGRGRLLGWSGILFGIFLIVALYNVLQRRNERGVLAQQTERLSVVHVAVIHATPVQAESQLILPGNVQSYVESPIYARTNGYLKKWYRDIGSHVKEGDLLADIDTPEVDEQLSQARADLATAQANVKLAGVTAERYEGLLKSDAVSKQEVDNFTGDYAAKQAMVASAEANVKRLEEMESFNHVYAPFSGLITLRNVDVGTLVNAGNTLLFRVAQTGTLRTYVNVPQTDANSVRPGQAARLTV